MLKDLGGLPKRMACVLVSDPNPILYHGEVLWRNGERVSDIRVGSYGHTLGGSVGLSMLASSLDTPVNKRYIEEGEWQVEIANQFFPCQVSLQPFYDPKNLRVKV